MGRWIVNGVLTNRHLEIDVYDVAQIEKIKKWVMKYHWFEKTLFFQDLVVFKHVERRIIIEKIHEEIRHFGESWTLAKVKKRCF
jgi:hypothetical protein